MASIPMATEHTAMGIKPMRNKRIIVRIPTPGIHIMGVTSPVLGERRATGSHARDELVFASAAAAFRHSKSPRWSLLFSPRSTSS